MSFDQYKPVIGLEVHAQLSTASKAFNADSTQFGSMPNTQVSVITLGHPGTLPKLNKKVVEYALKMGLACNSQITRYNIFDRKNYFYPDLPKGYQITQDKTPICKGGYVTIKTKAGETKNISLTRIHMEEDAGKSMHLAGEIDSLIDFNRAGVPLIEIVSDPVISTAEEAYLYLTEIRKLVRYLDICDGNMEEGSLRCDVNISVMKKDATTFGKKVEVKNLNSFKNVMRAIEYEMQRQILQLEKGETVISETRNFDATTGITTSLRTKEDLNDYRYFPEPDLAPLVITDAWLAAIQQSLPSLPAALFQKFTATFGLPEYDAQVLTDQKDIALFFETLCSKTPHFKAASNWVMGPVKSYLNELTLDLADFPLTPDHIAELIQMIEENKISYTVAYQKIFPELIQHPDKTALDVAQEMDLIQNTDTEQVAVIIQQVLAAMPDKVAAYKSGKKGLVGLFMGEIMKQTKGKADPKTTNKLLLEMLEQ